MLESRSISHPLSHFQLGVGLALSVIRAEGPDLVTAPDLSEPCNHAIAELEQAIDKSNRLYAAGVLRNILQRMNRLDTGHAHRDIWILGLSAGENIVEKEVEELERFYKES